MARRGRTSDSLTVNLNRVETLRRLREMGNHVVEAAKASLKDGADIIVADAKSRCPVRTGKLRESIKAEANRDGTAYKITAYAKNKGFNYAPIVEYSPRGQAFMEPAYEANVNAIYENVRSAISHAVAGHA